jgi:hypothetical protein
LRLFSPVLAAGITCAVALSQEAGKQDVPPAAQAARAAAAARLARQVLSFSLDEKTTIKDLAAEDDALRADASPLIQAAAMTLPDRFDLDGSCEVRLTIAGEAVKANLVKAFPKAQDKLKALFEKGLPPEIAVTGRGTGAAPDGRESAPAQPKDRGLADLPGWRDVSGMDRLRAEQAAWKDASTKAAAKLRGLRVQAGASLADLAGKDKALSAALDEFLGKVRPARKFYLVDGTVQVDVDLTPTDLAAAIQAPPEPGKSKVDVPQATVDLLKTLPTARLTVEGYARVDGKPVDEKVVAQKAPFPSPAVLLKDLEKPK